MAQYTMENGRMDHDAIERDRDALTEAKRLVLSATETLQAAQRDGDHDEFRDEIDLLDTIADNIDLEAKRLEERVGSAECAELVATGQITVLELVQGRA